MSWAVQLLNNTYTAQDDTSMRVWDDEEVWTQMSVVPSYVHSADDLGDGHGCRPGTEGEAAVLSNMW